MTNDHYEQVIGWLRERGHTAAEIDLIVERLRAYDRKMTVDSLMDAIAVGEIDLDSIVQEVENR